MAVRLEGFRSHSKASERYADVKFEYPNGFIFVTSVPLEYRRTGTDIPEEEVWDYLEKVFTEADPDNWSNWRREQEKFWLEKPGAGITKSFYDVLALEFKWCCVKCELPENPNWARRIQDLKEFGYTLSTHTNMECAKCKTSGTHLVMLPIARGGITGYESWSPELRKKIVVILECYDVFEAKKGRKEGLLPDHKFPEIRWDDETRRDSLEHLNETEIKRDFQLLSNQRNQQKREVCRTCFQTGKRGIIYGIPYFYSGNDEWDKSIPARGKQAENGCVGCGWYDIKEWRSNLINSLK